MSDKKTANNTINLPKLQKLIDGEQSRQVIADKIGCNVSLVTRHYNGDRIVTIDYLKKYAEYFGVSADYLLDLSEAKTTDKDLQYICDYTGLNEDSIFFFYLARFSFLSEFFEYLFYEIAEEEIEFFKTYELPNTKLFSNQPKSIIENIPLTKCISLLAEIHKLQEENEKYEDIIYSAFKKRHNALTEYEKSNVDNLDYDKISEIIEFADEEAYKAANDKTILEKEMLLNGNKYYISKVFNSALDKYIEMKAGEENE